jgi:hypothetical protein
MSLGGKTNVLQTIYGTKKLLGKANTTILADPNIETIGSNLQLSTGIIFGQLLPEDPSGSFSGLPLTLPATYSIATNSLAEPVAEYVRLTLTSIPGSTYDADGLSNSQLVAGLDSGGDVLLGGTGTSAAGPHSYQASLPSDYGTQSNNSKADTGVFTGSQVLHESAGKLQIIQQNFSTLAPNPYTPKLYESDGNTEILADDFTDWIVDAYAGIVYVQDYDAGKVPAFLDCWVYIGDMANEAQSVPSAATISGSFTDASSSLASRVTTLETNPSGLWTGSNGPITRESDVIVTGSLIVTNDINANTITANTYIVSSSVSNITTNFSSGSTKFGDSYDDTHQVTGSILTISSGSRTDNVLYNEILGGSNYTRIYDGDYDVEIGVGGIPVFGKPTSGAGNVTYFLHDGMFQTKLGGALGPGAGNSSFHITGSHFSGNIALKKYGSSNSWGIFELATSGIMKYDFSNQDYFGDLDIGSSFTYTGTSGGGFTAHGILNVGGSGVTIQFDTTNPFSQTRKFVLDTNGIVVSSPGTTQTLGANYDGFTYASNYFSDNNGVDRAIPDVGLVRTLVSSSFTSNEFGASGSFSGSFQGDGTNLTGITAEWDGTLAGDASITGSLVVSQSGTEALTVYGSGSSIFEVVGSQGTLWNITDSLSGSLFGVGDVSGFQQFEVFSNGDVYMGDEAQIQTLYRTSKISSTALATTESIVTFNSSSFDGAFIDYTAVKGTNARAGSIMAIWNGGNVAFTETTTTDIGDTSGVSINVEVVGSAIGVRSVTTTSGWNIKATTRVI